MRTEAQRRALRMARIVDLFSCLPGESQQLVLDTILDLIAAHHNNHDAADRRNALIQLIRPAQGSTVPPVDGDWCGYMR